MPAADRRLRIATRGSALARRQASLVGDLVRERHPDLAVELTIVTTRGDADHRAFGDIGGKGLFVAEVERAVAEGAADLAVHSAKDLTSELAEGCLIVCVPQRASAADVVVGGSGSTGEERLGSLARGARVGTSSMRRRALLMEARPDLDVVPLRGNLDTRLRRVAEGELDAAILALAGIERLGADGVPMAALEPTWWVPAPGQGALAVEARADRLDVLETFHGLGDPETEAELACERSFAATIEGGCSVPLGCYARCTGGDLVVAGYVGDPATGGGVRDRTSGPAAAAVQLGAELAAALLDAGGAEIVESLRPERPPEPP